MKIIPFIFFALIVSLLSWYFFSPEEDPQVWEFGNLTGSGLSEDYVRANPAQFPLSGFPEAQPYKRAMFGGSEQNNIPPGAWGGGGGAGVTGAVAGYGYTGKSN